MTVVIVLMFLTVFVQIRCRNMGESEIRDVRTGD